jgi:hypothetical protein
MAGMLPRPERSGLGRGRGSRSRYPDEALPMAIILSRVAGQGRSLHAAALELFMWRYPVPEETLRRAIAWVIIRNERRAGRVREAGYKAANRATARAKRLGVNHPVLLAYRVEMGLPLDARRKRRREYKQAAEIGVTLALYDDLPPPELIVEWLRCNGLPDTAEIVERSLSEVDEAGDNEAEEAGETTLDPASDLARQQIATVPFKRLCAARFVGEVWRLTFMFLTGAALVGDPEAVFMVQHLETVEHAKYVNAVMSFFSSPEEIASGLIKLATDDLAFETTWELCRQTYSFAEAIFMRASHTGDVDPGFTNFLESHIEPWPDEVPDLPPLGIEELWQMANHFQ